MFFKRTEADNRRCFVALDGSQVVGTTFMLWWKKEGEVFRRIHESEAF